LINLLALYFRASQSKQPSTPPFKTVGTDDLNVCGKQAVSMLASDSAVLQPYFAFSDGVFHSSLEGVINKIWNGGISSTVDAKALFRDVLTQEQQRQNDKSDKKLSSIEE